jgi:hypothetical protein
MENTFIERPWRSVKYEDIYLKAYGSIADSPFISYYHTALYPHHIPVAKKTTPSHKKALYNKC